MVTEKPSVQRAAEHPREARLPKPPSSFDDSPLPVSVPPVAPECHTEKLWCASTGNSHWRMGSVVCNFFYNFFFLGIAHV